MKKFLFFFFALLPLMMLANPGDLIFSASPKGENCSRLLADGRLLQIADYPVLFASIGTTYGGNGTTTFALPDYRNQFVRGCGAGQIGTTGGTDSVEITIANLPPHSHTIAASTGLGNIHNPSPTSYLASGQTGSSPSKIYRPDHNTTLAPDIVSSVGSGQKLCVIPQYMGVYIYIETGI